LIGVTDGGGALTLVIEATLEPTTWLIVTGWEATSVERKILGSWSMSSSPWTDLEPQPGDFDEDLATVDPRYVERHRGRPDGKLRILLSVEGEDADRLQRIAAARGQRPTDLVAELLRAADRPAA
jgi:hypothetical protein